MLLHPTIFRMYDIRGKAYEAFDGEGFYVLGRAIAQYVEKNQESNPKNQSLKVFVSGDGRQSMGDLYPALIKGLSDEGAQVSVGGLLPTPLNYFAFHEGGFDLSLQISASHNPWYDNGLKIHGKDGAIWGEQIQEIREMAETLMGQLPVTSYQLSNSTIPFDQGGYFNPYVHKLQSIVPSQKPLKIIVDSGNAIPGAFYPKVLRLFGHEVIELYGELDTKFPHHQPDPEEVENMADCRAKVLETKADLGLVFDGDGDRVGVILNDGTILNADKILYVLAVDMLSRNPGASVVIDVMSSDILAQKIEEAGGTLHRSPTGHSYIEEAMKAHGALFGGEQSGHFMFGENFYGHDDALLASLRFISALERDPALIKEVTTTWPDLIEYSEKFVVPDERKFEIMKEYVQTMKKEFPEAENLDGIRVSFGDTEWAIVRPSNTSPKISVRIEARDEKSLKDKKAVLVGALKKLIS